MKYKSVSRDIKVLSPGKKVRRTGMSFDRTKSKVSWPSRRKLRKSTVMHWFALHSYRVCFSQCSNAGEESDKRVHKFGFSLFGSTRSLSPSLCMCRIFGLAKISVSKRFRMLNSRK